MRSWRFLFLYSQREIHYDWGICRESFVFFWFFAHIQTFSSYPFLSHSYCLIDFDWMNVWLVVWNIFCFSIYWECHHPNWRTHIFQRGRAGSTTNQMWSSSFPSSESIGIHAMERHVEIRVNKNECFKPYLPLFTYVWIYRNIINGVFS